MQTNNNHHQVWYPPGFGHNNTQTNTAPAPLSNENLARVNNTQFQFVNYTAQSYTAPINKLQIIRVLQKNYQALQGYINLVNKQLNDNIDFQACVRGIEYSLYADDRDFISSIKHTTTGCNYNPEIAQHILNNLSAALKPLEEENFYLFNEYTNKIIVELLICLGFYELTQNSSKSISTQKILLDIFESLLVKHKNLSLDEIKNVYLSNPEDINQLQVNTSVKRSYETLTSAAQFYLCLLEKLGPNNIANYENKKEELQKKINLFTRIWNNDTISLQKLLLNIFEKDLEEYKSTANAHAIKAYKYGFIIQPVLFEKNEIAHTFDIKAKQNFASALQAANLYLFTLNTMGNNFEDFAQKKAKIEAEIQELTNLQSDEQIRAKYSK